MTDSQQDTIDFTMMYVTHDAQRRDLGRLTNAAAAGKERVPTVRAGWENFKAQLHIHQTVEDDDLWPRLYRAVGDQPAELALLKEMETEHAVLDPLLSAVDEALTRQPQEPLEQRLEDLTAALDAHLEHEENIQAVLSTEDWRGFAKSMARAQGIKGAAGLHPLDRRRNGRRTHPVLLCAPRPDPAHQPAVGGAALPQARTVGS